MDSARSGSIGHRMHASPPNKRSVLEGLTLMRCSAINQPRPALNVTAHSWSVFPFCSSLRGIISVMTPRASHHGDDLQTTFTSLATCIRFMEELQFLESLTAYVQSFGSEIGRAG